MREIFMFTIYGMAVASLLTGCATLTSDANVPVTLSFSNGSSGSCKLTNKRIALEVDVPGTNMIRRSDDDLKFDCTTEEGKTAIGQIPSTVGAKIIASAVFLDFGIVDGITDMHREYPANFVVPITK